MGVRSRVRTRRRSHRSLALGLRCVLRSGRGATWGPIVIAMAAVGFIISGLVPTDPALGYPPGEPPTATLAGRIHQGAGTLVFGGLSAAWQDGSVLMPGGWRPSGGLHRPGSLKTAPIVAGAVGGSKCSGSRRGGVDNVHTGVGSGRMWVGFLTFLGPFALPQGPYGAAVSAFCQSPTTLLSLSRKYSFQPDAGTAILPRTVSPP